MAESQSVFWGRARDKRNKGRVNHKMIYVHFFLKFNICLESYEWKISLIAKIATNPDTAFTLCQTGVSHVNTVITITPGYRCYDYPHFINSEVEEWL